MASILEHVSNNPIERIQVTKPRRSLGSGSEFRCALCRGYHCRQRFRGGHKGPKTATQFSHLLDQSRVRTICERDADQIGEAADVIPPYFFREARDMLYQPLPLFFCQSRLATSAFRCCPHFSSASRFSARYS